MILPGPYDSVFVAMFCMSVCMCLSMYVCISVYMCICIYSLMIRVLLVALYVCPYIVLPAFMYMYFRYARPVLDCHLSPACMCICMFVFVVVCMYV